MAHSLLVIVTLAASLGLAACSRSDAAPTAPTAPAPAAQPAGRIDIAVTSEGFVPKTARVKVGEPVTLVVTRKVDKTCATDIVIKDYGVNKPLPRDQPVEVTFTPTKPGSIRYACAMNMVAGELIAE